MIYAIEKLEEDSFMFSKKTIQLFETEKLRDRIFNDKIDYAKKCRYTEDLSFSNDAIKYYSGKLCINISKTSFVVYNEENIKELIH